MSERSICQFCEGTGFANDTFCLCPTGWAWRSAPRVVVGNETLVFPPGTTMEEARAAVDEGKRRYLESLS